MSPLPGLDATVGRGGLTSRDVGAVSRRRARTCGEAEPRLEAYGLADASPSATIDRPSSTGIAANAGTTLAHQVWTRARRQDAKASDRTSSSDSAATR